MKFGLSTVFFMDDWVRNNKVVGRSELQQLKSAGIDIVEVFCGAPKPYGKNAEGNLPYTDTAGIDAFIQAADEIGIERHSVHAPYNLTKPQERFMRNLVADGLSETEAQRLADKFQVADWDLTQPNNEAGVAAMKSLGDLVVKMSAKILVAHINHVHYLNDEERENLRQNLLAIVPYYEENNIALGLEYIHPVAIEFVKSFESPSIGFVLCTHHTLTTEDHPDYGVYPPTEPLVKVIEELDDKLIHLHLNDVAIANEGIRDQMSEYSFTGQNIERLMADEAMMGHFIPYDIEGSIDWEPLVAAFKRVNFDGLYLFEPGGVFPQYREEYLKKITDGFERMRQTAEAL